MEVGWGDLLSLISALGASKGPKCQIRLLDTVITDQSGEIGWFFTTKTNAISRKKPDTVNPAGISDRFAKFALSNPQNVKKYVGVLVSSNSRVSLTESDLIAGLNNPPFPSVGGFLQVYIRPYRGLNATAKLVISVNIDGALQLSPVFPADSVGMEPSYQSGVSAQIISFGKHLSVYLYENKSWMTQSAVLNFIIDDNQHAWLSSITEYVYAESKDLSVPVFSLQNAVVDNAASSFTLPALRSSLEVAVSPPQSAGQRGADSSRPTSSKSTGRPSSKSRPISEEGGDVIVKEGAVHKCLKGVDSLPGMRAWVVSFLHADGRPAWSVDLSSYSGGIVDYVEESSLTSTRSVERHAENQDLVLLARLADRMGLLSGRAAVHDEESFINAWRSLARQVEETTRNRLSQAPSEELEVIVCGNLYAVCRKLDSLRSCQFRPSGNARDFVENETDRPKSDSALTRTKSRAGGRQSHAQVEPAGVGWEELDKDEDEDADGLLLSKQQQQQHHTQSSPAISTSLLTSKMRAQQSESGSTGLSPRRGAKAKKMKSVYGSSTVVGSKPKHATDASFKRNAMDEPPSVDLIAKFALEKEKLKGEDVKTVKVKPMRKRREDDSSEGGIEAPGVDRTTAVPKQKVINPKKVDPNYDRSLTKEEARIAELERQANLNASVLYEHRQLQQQFQSNGFGSLHSGYNPGGSMISNSEADFMVRQVQTGGITDLGILGVGDEVFEMGSVLSMDSATRGGGGGLLEKMQEALNERIASLEKQLDAANNNIKRKDAEFSKVDERARRLAVELDVLKRSSAKALEQVREEHELQVLKLKQQHAAEMAFIAAVGPEESAAQDKDDPTVITASTKNRAAPIKTALEGNYEANKNLIEQLELQREENRKLSEKASDLRRALQVETNTKLLTQERQFKAEIVSLRSRMTELEDLVSQKEDELATARGRIDSLIGQSRELERAKTDALDTQNRLRSELKSMQQSVATTYRMESAQNITTGTDPETAIRLTEAKAEAKVRQLTNKVDFLKAQLDTEQAASDGLRKALDVSKTKLDDLKDEFRLRMHEAEQIRKTAVQEAEQRVENLYEERMMELTTLQTKMAMVQGQLQDAFQEQTIGKQREDVLKAATQRAQSQLAAAKAESEHLMNQLNEMREDRDNLAAKNSESHSHDAMMRRLDNERQYLKSQLTSEITHKNELQKALTQCQQQLGEVQRQWKEDVESLKETALSDQQAAMNVEQRLKQSIIRLESEEARIKGQNKDLKEAFTKMRDQLRMEQLSIENLSTLNRQLQEEIENGRLEIERLKIAESTAAQLQRNQMSAMESTISELEERRVREISKLKEELAKQYGVVSKGQNDILGLRDAFDKEKYRTLQSISAVTIKKLLEKWLHNRMSNFFRVWSTNATLVGVAQQFRGQVGELVKDTLRQGKEDKQQALKAQELRLREEQEDQAKALRAMFAVELQQALRQAEEEKLAALNRLQDDHTQHLEEQSQQFVLELRKAQEDSLDEMEEALRKKEAEIDRIVVKHEKEMESARLKEIRNIAEAREAATQEEAAIWKEKLQARESELSENFEDDKMDLTAKFNQKLSNTVKTAQEQLRSRLFELEAAHSKAIEETEALHAENVQKVRHEFMQQQREVEEAWKLKTDQQLSEIRMASHEEAEARIRDLRELWEVELEKKLAAKDRANEELMEKKMTEHSQKLEADRIRGLKLEASKWKQAMKDVELKYSLDADKAKSLGRSEVELEMKEMKIQLENSHRLALQKIADETKETLLQMKMECDERIITLTNAKDAECEDAVKKMESNTKFRLDKQWSEEVRVKVEEAWSDAAAMWKAKVETEQRRLEQFKKDVTTHTQRIADERSEMLQKMDTYDKTIARLESSKQADLDLLTKEFEKKMESAQRQAERDKREALDELSKQQDEIVVGLEAKFQAAADERIRIQKEAAVEEMEQHMKQVNKDSELLVSSLELAMKDLRKEKVALSAELETTVTKLENAEDSIFDLQQEMKKKEKEHSIAIWRMLAANQRMRINNKKGLEEYEKDVLDEKMQMKKELQQRSENMILVALKYSSLLAEVEAARKKVLAVLSTHKADILAERRTQIRMVEKELERIGVERDSFEEQRDAMEDEVESLEIQVRDLEEQIREHNRSSTMQNGRINVAHARKKKRLDGELERILDLIEQRRASISEMDERSAEKSRQRDMKEAQMVDWERELVQILVEQQKLVVGIMEESRTVEDKGRLIASTSHFPWPGPPNPTATDVSAVSQELDHQRR